MLTFLAARAIDSVEMVGDGRYRRAVEGGSVAVSREPDEPAVRVQVIGAAAGIGDAGGAPQPTLSRGRGLVQRVRLVFDLDADCGTIGADLSRDPFMAGLVARRPGLRCPGAWDGFELAVRAVLGQQVTVAFARTLAGRLAALCGAPVESAGLTRAFPTPQAVADADLEAIGMPAARRRTLRAVAHAALADPALFQPPARPEHAARLMAIPGIGAWTAQYILMRAIRDMDAFPASDVGLLRAVAVGRSRPTPQELLARAEAWRPWRAYAAQHLWASAANMTQAERATSP